jgi:hypothetical protein
MNKMTSKEAQVFLRKVLGPPRETLEGKELEQTMLLIAMIEPFSATNNQHSWTECYMIGETEYHVTTFPSSEIVVEKLLLK